MMHVHYKGIFEAVQGWCYCCGRQQSGLQKQARAAQSWLQQQLRSTRQNSTMSSAMRAQQMMHPWVQALRCTHGAAFWGAGWAPCAQLKRRTVQGMSRCTPSP